ncbi:MAG: hypothetical protein GF388_04315 [Candidatus Aegiribacteria sp.]|nr:hypothetical protein [Candidatus Aegiribacteria sp.]MBD3294463.1 hypothetical protein [Candidatus Fermentibacteria bacterium]
MYQKKMVDLLLVRLSREEEKKKVINLLKSELGMTQEEAREQVENSPSILKENVEMEQGRILQDRMYPFVDLLPRYYNQGQDGQDTDDAEPPPDKDEETATPSQDTDVPVSPSIEEQEDIEIEEDDFVSVSGNGLDEDASEDDVGEIYHNQSAYRDEENQDEDTEDDFLVITSAAEEVQSVARCHICGRTPTGEDKLVPCRTCAKPTCASCYDRKKHVCVRCAAQGLDADRPLDSVPAARDTEEEPARKAVRSTQKRQGRPEKSAPAKGGSLSRISTPVIVITGLVLVAIAFFIIDPMGLFAQQQTSDSEELIDAADSTEVAVQDTAAMNPDSVPVDSTVYEDSLQVPEDSISVDSSAVSPHIALAEIVIPDSLRSDSSYAIPRYLTRTSIEGVQIYTDHLETTGQILGELSDFHSLQLDAFTLISTESGHDVLLMSILHPEPAERRASFMGSLGTVLDSTMVDQMVLYYRENVYYDPVIFSFTADSFSVLSRSSSPFSLQRKQQTIPETYDMVSGSIFEWMTDLD